MLKYSNSMRAPSEITPTKKKREWTLNGRIALSAIETDRLDAGEKGFKFAPDVEKRKKRRLYGEREGLPKNKMKNGEADGEQTSLEESKHSQSVKDFITTRPRACNFNMTRYKKSLHETNPV